MRENWVRRQQWSAVVDEGGEFDCFLVARFNLSGAKANALTELIMKSVLGSIYADSLPYQADVT